LELSLRYAEELKKRLAGTGLENFIPTDLGDISKV